MNDSEKELLVAELGQLLLAGDLPVTAETELATLPGWDSMGQLEFLSFLDERFHRTLEAGVLEKMRTVGDLVALAEGGPKTGAA